MNEVLVDIRVRIYCESWLHLVEARGIRHRAYVAVLNVAFATAAIAIEEVSVVTLLRNDNTVSANVFTFQILVGEESPVHLVASEAEIPRL